MRPSGGVRRALRAAYAANVRHVMSVLATHDPMSLALGGANPAEYEPEARGIVRRAKEASSSAELQRIIHEELVARYGVRAVGPAAGYARIAREIRSFVGRRN